MLFAHIKFYALNKPNHIAVKDANIRKSISYEELWSIICEYRNILHSKGISKQSKILLALSNQISWITIFLSCISLGAKVIPISPDVSFLQSKFFEKELKPDVIIDSKNVESFFKENITNDGNELEWGDKDDEVLFHPTSGSTGNSKYCIRTLWQLCAEGVSYQKTLDLSSSDIIVNPLPLYHSFALGAVIMAGFTSGATVIIFQNFNPRKFLKIIESEKATITLGVPIIARTLGDVFLPYKVDLTLLRIFLIGSGEISETTYNAILKKYGVRLLSNYGSTETGGIVTRLKMEPIASVGVPMKGVKIEIRDNAERVLSHNQEGSIWVKTDAMLKRYWNDEPIFDKRGFFPMKDLGYFDKNGNLYITGRESTLLKIGGNKINLSTIENILQQHPEVQDAAVVGRKRSNGEEIVKAVIVPKKNISVQEIKDYAKKNMESHMVPTVITFIKALPRNELGKVKKEELLEV